MNNYNILVTIDNNYLPPLKVMLKSLFDNNPQGQFNIYLVYHDVTKENIKIIEAFCKIHQAKFYPILISQETFKDAPTSDRYSQTMYYRLLAYSVLPKDLDKMLYLDPDIVVINSIETLYNIDLEDNLFAGAIHTQLTPLADQVNKIRLGTYEAEGYYNSGVLLMNLKQQRKEIDEADVFAYIKEHEDELILPDQDVLNGLYGKKILSIDDSLYNYDTRNFETYRLWDTDKNMTWVIQNTVILHYCGKNKPWKKVSAPRFAMLYKHYEQRAKIVDELLNK